jgi:hypothetical protein
MSRKPAGTKSLICSAEAYEKLKEHKQKTFRGSIQNSIDWLVLKYADQDIKRTEQELQQQEED